MAMPVAGDHVPRLGNLVTRALGRGLLALLGWRVDGALAAMDGRADGAHVIGLAMAALSACRL